ncbi:MAG: hypothetical protein A2Y17_00730 [Clostridiales bacterium GWF2_38_85]|nr:MAG: hypothetical protein A2Y17_00730 [Clostridiales bacterium GWF2_38_85]
MNNIGERIKELRKKNDMTQEKLAEQLGVSYQAVSKWETGIACPDLSLIVPLARLLHVSTDELLGYKDRRAVLEKMWQKALQLGVHETLKMSEAALKEYPHDQTFLYRRACDESFYADETTDAEQKREYLERSVRHFKMLISEYPDFNFAVEMLVTVLPKLGRHEEALSYAMKQPDKDRLLKHCLTGEELEKHRQKLIEQKMTNLITELISNRHNLLCIQAAVNIIKIIISDGNYLEYHDTLMHYYVWQAQCLVRENRHDEAIEALRTALQHAKECKVLEKEGQLLPYTTPILNRLSFDTKKISDFNPMRQLHDYITISEFDAIRDREDFIALTKEG